MRLIVIATVGAILVAGVVRADDASAEVIKKAIKAHGGADNLKKALSVRGTASGTMYRNGTSVTGEIEYVVRLPDYERVTTKLKADPNKVIGIIAKDQFYLKYGNQALELSAVEQAEKKQNLLKQHALTLLPILVDKTYTTSSAGELLVGTVKTTGVRVQKDKCLDVTLYFDNHSGLLVKMIDRGVAGQNPVTRELHYSEYKEIDGVMRPMKVEASSEGKLLMKYLVQEEKLGQEIKDSEFAKP